MSRQKNAAEMKCRERKGKQNWNKVSSYILKFVFFFYSTLFVYLLRLSIVIDNPMPANHDFRWEQKRKGTGQWLCFHFKLLLLPRSSVIPKWTLFVLLCVLFFLYYFAIRSLFERNIGFPALSHIRLKLSTEANRRTLISIRVFFLLHNSRLSILRKKAIQCLCHMIAIHNRRIGFYHPSSPMVALFIVLLFLFSGHIWYTRPQR